MKYINVKFEKEKYNKIMELTSILTDIIYINCQIMNLEDEDFSTIDLKKLQKLIDTIHPQTPYDFDMNSFRKHPWDTLIEAEECRNYLYAALFLDEHGFGDKIGDEK